MISFDLSFIRLHRSVTFQYDSFSQTAPERLIFRWCSKELCLVYLEQDVIMTSNHCSRMLFFERGEAVLDGMRENVTDAVTVSSDLEKCHLQWTPKLSCLGA